MEWTRPTSPGSDLRALACVDGVLLLAEGATVTALDVRTGETRWHAPASTGAIDGNALTDGEVVLLPVDPGDGSVDLVAHRIADGSVVRRTQAPPGTVMLRVVDRHLVASTGTEVIGLG